MIHAKINDLQVTINLSLLYTKNVIRTYNFLFFSFSISSFYLLILSSIYTIKPSKYKHQTENERLLNFKK